MRRINQAGAFLFAVVFVLGPPSATATWISHQRWHWPTHADAQRWMAQPLSAGTIVAGLALVAGVGWFVLTVYLLRYAVSVLARWLRRIRRMPLPSPAQATAGSMAGVAALAMPVVVAPHADAPGPGVIAAVPHLSEPTGATVPDSSGGGVVAEREGVALPGGGWIPYRTAGAVAALAGLVWLYRRQHYRPGPPRLGRHESDPDLRPLPVTVDAITATVTEDGAPPQALTSATLVDDLPPGQLVLHGPGAVDAVRGLLVTAVMSAALADQIDITVHGQDLLDLVDVGPGRHLPGLRVEHSGPAAVGSPEPSDPELMLTITRRSAGTDGERPNPGPSRDNGGITTDMIVSADAGALSGWHVAADGTVTACDAAAPIRLPHLPRQAAADLISLVGLHRNGRGHSRPTAQASSPPQVHHQAPGRLTMLSGCRLLVNGAPVRFHRSAGLQILAYLAVYPEGASTSELVRAIWPGITPESIAGRLYTTVNGLRNQLQPDLADPLRRDGERYQLNPAAIETDLHEIRQALEAVTSAVTAQQRHDTASQLIDRYRGELAEGFSWPWLQPAREALRRDLIDAYLHLAQGADPAVVTDLMRAATAVDPDNTDLHRRAQALLTATGRHTKVHDLGDGFTNRRSRADLYPAGDETPPRPSGR